MWPRDVCYATMFSANICFSEKKKQHKKKWVENILLLAKWAGVTSLSNVTMYIHNCSYVLYIYKHDQPIHNVCRGTLPTLSKYESALQAIVQLCEPRVDDT